MAAILDLGVCNSKMVAVSRSHLRETQWNSSVDTALVSTLWCFESLGD